MKTQRAAITLIEVVIVTIIMAVLAATIIPQLSSSNKEVKMSNLKFNLRTIRSRLEKYKEQNGGAYPPATTSAEFRSQLTKRAGNNSTKPNTAFTEGDVPINPFNNSTSVAILQGDTEPTAPTGSSDGWQYNPLHGWFYPNNIEYFRDGGL